MRVDFFVFLLNLICFSVTIDDDNFNRYIIACHTTDFVCFKRQYLSLRDNVLLGNTRLLIEPYDPYVFEYGDSGTCIKISGLQHSELIAISMDYQSHELSYTLHTPLKMEQITRENVTCCKPDLAFRDIPPQGNNNNMKRFKANATIQATFPYNLLQKKTVGEVYLVLSDEDIDLILDIPDLSNYNKESKFEESVYLASEWAYQVIQHVDAAQHVALPYTRRIRKFYTHTPLQRLILLYPEESYRSLQFDFYDEQTVS